MGKKDRTERHVSVTISVKWSSYNQLLDIAEVRGESLSAVASRFIEEGIERGADQLKFADAPDGDSDGHPREMTADEERELEQLEQRT